MNDPLTYRYKRSLAEAFPCDATQAVAIHKYKPPLARRFFYALIRSGWVVFAVVLALLVLAGCDDTRAEEATAASLRDALAQAQRERPDLWTPEQKARADVAAQIAARRP